MRRNWKDEGDATQDQFCLSSSFTSSKQAYTNIREFTGTLSNFIPGSLTTFQTLNSTSGSRLAAAVSTSDRPLLTELEVGHRIKPQPHEAFKCWSQPSPPLFLRSCHKTTFQGQVIFSHKLMSSSNFRASCPPPSGNIPGQREDS